MTPLMLPPLTVDDLLRMVGERDVRIEQLTRRVLELQAAPPPAPAATVLPAPEVPRHDP